MKFTTRQLALIAVFGALWGAVEISLGTLLKSLNVPLSGAFLAAIGLTVALIARRFVPQRGSTLFVGAVAMLLKLFSLGGVVIGPRVGIIAEAVIAEVVLSAFGQPRRASFLLAAALGTLWTLAQPFFTGLVLFGRDLFSIWAGVINNGSRLLGLPDNAALLIVVVLVGLHLLIGAAGGFFAWQAGSRLGTRLHGQASANA